MAPADATTRDLIDLVNFSGHSRIPVYEGTMGRVTGIVEAHDLLPFLQADAKVLRARGIARPSFLVAPSRLVGALLADMQREGVQMVAVGNDAREVLGVV